MAVGEQALPTFRDRGVFVALASVTDNESVPSAIVQTLNILFERETPLNRLKSYLQERQFLLILDNFEQILGAAGMVADLLATSQGLKVLVTSRAPLRIRWETLFPVPALTLSNVESSGDSVLASAIELFVARAQTVKPDFKLNDQNRAAVAAICARLDGLPLAIELIAARVKLLSPERLLERLSGRLMLTSDSLRDLEPRHRTLNAAIDWSYHLLTAAEQTLFRRLGVFVGGCTLEAAEAICSEAFGGDVLDGIGALVDHNLLVQSMDDVGEPRFTMLETIHEYTLAQLAVHEEMEALRARHAACYLTLVIEAEPHFYRGTQIVWLRRIEADYANIRAAFDWYLETPDPDEGALQIVGALKRFWMLRSNSVHGFQWAQAALAKHAIPTRHRAKALNTAVAMATNTDRFDQAWVFNEEALYISRALNDLSLLSAATYVAVEEAWVGGKFELTEQLMEESGRLAEEANDSWWLATSCFQRADYYSTTIPARRDVARAKAYNEQGAIIARQYGDRYLIIRSLIFESHLAKNDEEHERAKSLLREMLLLSKEIENTFTTAIAHAVLGQIAIIEGDYQSAGVRFAECLRLDQSIDNRAGMVADVRDFARLATALGQWERATRLFGAIDIQRHHFFWIPYYPEEFEADILPAREHFADDADSFAKAWKEGQSMTLYEAATYALRADGSI